MWVKFLTGGQAVNLTAGITDVHVSRRNDIGGLDISPDGTQIAFPAGPQDANLTQLSTYVVGAPLGGAPRKLIDGGLGARWSPDGTKLAYVVPGGSAGDSLRVSDADGGNARKIVPLSGGIHTHWPAWSGNGEYVYFIRSITTQNLEPSEIYRVRAAGGSARARRDDDTARRLSGPRQGRQRSAVQREPDKFRAGALVDAGQRHPGADYDRRRRLRRGAAVD